MSDMKASLRALSIVLQTEGKANFFLRVPLGLIFFVHGAQKLFGWFDGNGLEATAQWMSTQLGGDGLMWAVLGGGAELLGGVALMLGLLVRPAALTLAIVMMVAIRAVHWEHGLLLQDGGYEFALSLLAGAAALLFGGAGAWSLDRLLTRIYKD